MSKFAQWGNTLYTGERSFDIVGRRRTWYAVSAVLIVLSLVGLFGRGINLGIEFRGGSEFRVSAASDVSEYEARAQEVVQAESPQAQVESTLVGSDTVRIQTQQLDTTTSEQVRLNLAEEFEVVDEDVTGSFVGPSWGQTVTVKAIQALVVFLLLVTIVLALYFRTWKMAAAALIALVHDLVFTVGIYALLGIEVSPASMIGFLTILGYSIYDTIVVFDKVRENTDAAFDSRRSTYGQAANLAVNQTLVRSINTSVVALLPVLVIVVVGVVFIGPGTLVDLSVALLIGIAVGTFSSIFIATPVLVQLRGSDEDVKALDAGVGRKDKRAAARRAGAEDVDVRIGGDEEQVPAPAGADVGDPGLPTTRERSTERGVHPLAQRGPRNQPKRPPRKRR